MRDSESRCGVDDDRALAKVDEYIGWCEQSESIQKADVVGWHRRPDWKALDQRIKEGLTLVEHIANEVDPRLVEKLRAHDAAIEHHAKLAASRELRGAIASRQEAAEILGPQGPRLVVADMHPVVWDNAAQLWSNGHRREAVQKAATALYDSHVPAKLGRQRDTRGAPTSWGRRSRPGHLSRMHQGCGSLSSPRARRSGRVRRRVR